ncbi:MAG: hypothetical protein H7Z16_09605 [Pyrinomonadaceae bacterium]|nr:hypothetical protein [Pyrinomonadaceae bacterium]
MRNRIWGMSVVGVLVLLIISSSEFVAQRPRNRTAPAAPAANDLKIKYRMTTSGQSMETTTMLKGARERSEMKMGFGMEIINITQCDLKRTLQISDKARKYVVTPMETVEAATSTRTDARVTAEPSRRGGVVTYNTSAVDTGERKDMFGFKARHVKTTMSVESSPDACNPMKMRMETDGWYIDFAFGLNCETGGSQMTGAPQAQGGCRDRMRFNRQGAARTGYPLLETTTMYGPGGEVTVTSTKEVIELSREPLDAALFDVPAGYVETMNAQELYAMPSMDSMMSQANEANAGRQSGAAAQNNQPSAGNAKAPGVIRIGVVPINNRTDRGISAASLRAGLISDIEGSGVEAVALNAISPGEIEAEAKSRQCDFVLYTYVSALKTSKAGKIGGMFGRAAGVGGLDKTEAKIEYQLFAVGETTARLQSAATAKEEGDEASAAKALEQEARMVVAEVKKNRQ